MKIIYGKESFELLDVTNNSTILEVKQEINSITNIPIESIRLIQRGKTLSNDINLNSLVGGIFGKITMIANNSLQSIQPNQNNDIRIKNDLANETKPLDIPKTREFTKDGYGFHSFETLPNFSDNHKARDILESLASDPGVLSVMKRHKWNVQCLGELYPEGYVGVSEVCVLGLNVNKGQKILLRLRTDDLEGFRKYETIKEVLCHELAHNVHSEHDDNFYLLMRQVEKEVDNLNWTKSSYYRIDKDEFSGRKWSEIFDKFVNKSDDKQKTLRIENNLIENSKDYTYVEDNAVTDNNFMDIEAYSQVFKETSDINTTTELNINPSKEVKIDSNLNISYDNIRLKEVDNNTENINANNSLDIILNTAVTSTEDKNSTTLNNHNDSMEIDNNNKYSNVITNINYTELYNKIDEAFAMALASESSSERIIRFIMTIKDVIDNTNGIVDISELSWLLSLYIKIFNNAKDSTNKKLRNINTNTNTFRKMLNLTKESGKELLLAGGFSYDMNNKDHMIYSYIDLGFLCYITDLLDMLLKCINN